MNNKLLIYELDCLNSLFLTDRKILKKVFSNIIIPRIAYYEFKNRVDDEIQQTNNNLTILSNHHCDYVKLYNLNTISMIDLLIKSYENELINMDEAEIFWSNMENITHYSGSFIDYFTDELN